MMTLVEFAKNTRDPLLAGYVETMYLEEGFMQYVPFRNIAGLALQFAREQALPSVAFRKLNEAFAESSGTLERVVEALKIFGGDSDTDKVLVDAYGPTERVARDQMHAKAMAVNFIQYLLYGNSGAKTGNAYDDVDGFDGVLSVIDTAQKVDGAGTTGSDGSTVFGFRFGPGFVQGLQTGVGLDVRNLGELETKPAYRTRVDWTSGWALYNKAGIGIIYDLTVAAKCSPTEMDQLQDKIPGGPDIYVMSKRSRRQLKEEAYGTGVMLETTIDAMGRPVPAWGGAPIVISDAVVDDEAVA